MAKMTNGSSEKLLGLQKLRAKVNAPGDPAHLQLEEESFKFLPGAGRTASLFSLLNEGLGTLVAKQVGRA